MVDQTSPSSGREATPAIDQRDDMACGDACRSDHPFGGPEVIGIVEAEKGPLRAALDVEGAIDVLWLHMARSGSDTLCRLLLPGR